MFGHEHYAENLEDLACAGVPIHHPISGRTVGAVDLTCWRKDAGSLLLTLAKTTAEQIRQALLADSGSSELELFQEYLRTCRRDGRHRLRPEQRRGDAERLRPDGARPGRPGGAARAGGRALTAATPQLARRQLPAGSDRPDVLPTGRRRRSPAGIVVHVKLVTPSRPAHRLRDAPVRVPLPGLVGTAPLWLHACEEVERAFRAR